MKTGSHFVSFLDIPEALPFSEKEEAEEDVIKSLDKFIAVLEKQFKENVVFIGDDIIGEKFYYRFLFKKGGFVEIMANPPVAIIAHFIEERRAQRFAKALKAAINKTVRDKKAREILKNVIEVSSGKESLGYNKWIKLKKIREM